MLRVICGGNQVKGRWLRATQATADVVVGGGQGRGDGGEALVTANTFPGASAMATAVDADSM